MSSPDNELQAAIYDILTADSALSAIIAGRVYDRVPMDGDIAPYVTFGPADVQSDDAECIEAGDHFLQIDVWSEKQGGFKECKEITHLIKRVLHKAEIDLPTHALVEMRVTNKRHLRDPDGITSHGIVTVEAMVEEN